MPARLVLLLCLLAAPSAFAQANDLTLMASATPLLTPQTTGTVGDFAVRWRIGRTFGLAANGRAGYLAASLWYPHEGVLALLVGPMAEWDVGRWQLHTAIQLAHVHNTALEDWATHTLANIAGDSAGSVAHRTGAEVSVGVTWPELLRGDKWRLVLETDATASVLPSSELLTWTAGIRIGVGIQRLVSAPQQPAALTTVLAAAAR
jgi:hypothetical protein